MKTTSGAKAGIFAAIRAARPGARTDAQQIAREAEACARAMQATLPPLDSADIVGLFATRAGAEKVGASVTRVATLADLPGAVAAYAAAQGLGPDFSLQPDPALQALDWSPLRPSAGIGPATPLAVGVARCGVAETGSLVFNSGAESPTLFGFLPDHHIVAIDAGKIHLSLEDYARAEQGSLAPRNVNFITGASGTTDIEGVLVRGAHGPRSLHIVIFG
jgi:L-lactate dehydrogenase complex protein LldG